MNKQLLKDLQAIISEDQIVTNDEELYDASADRYKNTQRQNVY